MFQQNGKPGANANFKKHLRSKSEDELKAELDAIFEKEEKTGIKIEPSLVTEYLSAIEEKEHNDQKTQPPGNFEESWAIFTKNHPDLFPKEKQSPQNRGTQARRFLEVVVLAAAILALSATAFDWPDYVVNWGKGLLHISPVISGTMELPEPNVDGYISLEAAVADICGEDVEIPRWIPERFAIKTLAVQTTIHLSIITAIYESADSDLMIRISYYENLSEVPNLSFEEDENSQTTYKTNQIEHFIVNNFDRLQALWKKKNCLYSISGDVSMEEMERMVNSIYGG